MNYVAYLYRRQHQKLYKTMGCNEFEKRYKSMRKTWLKRMRETKDNVLFVFFDEDNPNELIFFDWNFKLMSEKQFQDTIRKWELLDLITGAKIEDEKKHGIHYRDLRSQT